jgi:hypothetical protein
MTRSSSLGQGRWHPSTVGQVDAATGTAYLLDPVYGSVCVLLTNASHMAQDAAKGRAQAWLRLCRQVFGLLVTT